MPQLTIAKEKNQYHLFIITKEELKFYQITDLQDKQRKVKKDSCIFVFSSKLENFTTNIADLTELWGLLEVGGVYSLDELVSIISNNTEENKAILFFALVQKYSHYFTQISEYSFQVNSLVVAEDILQKTKDELAKVRLYDEYYSSLINLSKPNWAIDSDFLLNTRNKDSIEYKAFHNAVKHLGQDPYLFLYKAGLRDDLQSLLEEKFLKETYREPKNLLDIGDYSFDYSYIPLNSDIRAFSIDDAATVEIDDAMSVQYLESGYKVGIHIAAPALDYQLLDYAVDRVSTVYYPFNKIKMLPDNVIEYFSLNEGSTVPVVSIYFNLDTNFQVSDCSYELEQIYIDKNLRLEDLDINEDDDFTKDIIYAKEIHTLYKFALVLEEKRGKLSVNPFSMDYSFYRDQDNHISIKERKRGNPIDKLVSELMILTNCSFGRALTNSFTPAIYRAKQKNYPVKMTTTPSSHVGLNVDYYTWSSSPLRRSVDLINQYQIINMIQNTKRSLTMVSPELCYIIDNFDVTYSQYLLFQDQMERYWSLLYIQQNKLDKIQAIFLYKTQVQLLGLPMKLDVTGLTSASAQGTIIDLSIIGVDIVNLMLNFKIINKYEN